MTGPEHYAAGERCQRDAFEAPDITHAMYLTALAQAHYTAAQVAATITAVSAGDPEAVPSDWHQVLS